jgi:hypothetical protein
MKNETTQVHFTYNCNKKRSSLKFINNGLHEKYIFNYHQLIKYYGFGRIYMIRNPNWKKLILVRIDINLLSNHTLVYQAQFLFI